MINLFMQCLPNIHSCAFNQSFWTNKFGSGFRTWCSRTVCQIFYVISKTRWWIVKITIVTIRMMPQCTSRRANGCWRISLCIVRWRWSWSLCNRCAWEWTLIKTIVTSMEAARMCYNKSVCVGSGSKVFTIILIISILLHKHFLFWLIGIILFQMLCW